MIARLGALGKVDGENDGDYNKGACYISLFCVAKYSFFLAFYLILSFFSFSLVFFSLFLVFDVFIGGMFSYKKTKQRTKKKRFFGLQ